MLGTPLSGGRLKNEASSLTFTTFQTFHNCEDEEGRTVHDKILIILWPLEQTNYLRYNRFSKGLFTKLIKKFIQTEFETLSTEITKFIDEFKYLPSSASTQFQLQL